MLELSIKNNLYLQTTVQVRAGLGVYDTVCSKWQNNFKYVALIKLDPKSH